MDGLKPTLISRPNPTCPIRNHSEVASGAILICTILISSAASILDYFANQPVSTIDRGQVLADWILNRSKHGMSS